jgi:glycosyltransferase involved in cell wall biosynthesis
MHGVLSIAAWLIALAWLYKLAEAARGLPSVPNLLEARFDGAPVESPSVAVIVPAKNEAAGVKACLESLVGQDYSNLRVIAVDDRSTDETGAIMDRAAAAHAERLEVMHVAVLPAGWLGKTHAMATAARQAIAEHGPDYLLFTDGDIVFRRDALRRSLVAAVASEADHFVVMPTTVAKSRGEAMLLSFFQTMSMWGVRTWRVADPRAKRDAIGVGAFNLIRRDVYQRLGGFDATPMEVLEDLTLGRRVKAAGLRQQVATAPGMVSVHWAEGVAGLVNGLTKNMFAVFRFRPVLVIGAAVWLMLFCFGPLVFLGVRGARAPGAITLACIAGLYGLSSRTSRISPVYAGLYPVSTALVLYSMARSMAVTLQDGGVTWRGTFYPLAELRRNARAVGHGQDGKNSNGTEGGS